MENSIEGNEDYKRILDFHIAEGATKEISQFIAEMCLEFKKFSEYEMGNFIRVSNFLKSMNEDQQRDNTLSIVAMLTAFKENINITILRYIKEFGVNPLIRRDIYLAETMGFNTYAKKKAFVLEINNVVRHYDAAFTHPENQEPCSLVAVNSRDIYGRYSLENRVTKKRSGSYRTCEFLLCLPLIQDAPRKEGFLERRKKSNLD